MNFKESNMDWNISGGQSTSLLDTAVDGCFEQSDPVIHTQDDSVDFTLEGASKKDHVCPFCGKSFKGKWFLNRHVMIHTGAKPFKCEFCLKGFNQKSSLKSHIVGQHFNQSE